MKNNTPLFQLAGFVICLVFGLQSGFSQSSFPYTGEELFAGIYFSEGPVAEKVKTLKQYDYKNDISNPDIRKANQQFQNEVAATLRKDNPRFFDNLQTEVASGNVNRIRKVLDNGSQPVYDAMVKLMYSKTNNVKADDQSKELAYLQDFVNSYTGGVYSSGGEVDDKQALIALAAVWVAVVAWEYFWVSDEFIIDERVNNEGNLKKEQLVLDLSNL